MHPAIAENASRHNYNNRIQAIVDVLSCCKDSMVLFATAIEVLTEVMAMDYGRNLL